MASIILNDLQLERTTAMREIKYRVYGKREFVLSDQVSPLNSSLLFIISTRKSVEINANSIHNNCFKLFLSAHFSLRKFLNLNLAFAVFHKRDA